MPKLTVYFKNVSDVQNCAKIYQMFRKSYSNFEKHNFLQNRLINAT